MKKSIVIFIGFLMLSVVSAQADIKFGVKAGVNIAKPSFSGDVINPDNFVGFQGGLITEFTLPIVGLGMDAAILYSQQGLKLKTDNKDGDLGTLEIPVNLKFKISLMDVLGGYLTTGPSVNFSLADGFSGLKNEYEAKSFGFAWNFGFGVEVLSHLQVGANYRLGITDDYRYIKEVTGDEIKGKAHGWSITAAYFF